GFLAYLINWIVLVPSGLAKTAHYFDLAGSAAYVTDDAVALLHDPDQSAPEEAYATAESPYPGPTPRPLTGFLLWLGAGGGLMAAGTAGIRATKRQGSAPPNYSRAPEDS
ncbi:MAG: hypothetical protein GY925_15095, partial [Actinomycetia bacterium]|nr:hypothetical protein [Actinomycetes bacterium]